MAENRENQEPYRLARMWRLAALLTPDEESARSVMLRALRSPAPLDRTPPARLDRLVILRARERLSGRPANAPATSRLARVRAAHRRHAHRNGADGAGTRPDAAAKPTERRPVDSGAALCRRLAALPAQLREAWILHDFEGRGMVETARAMDCSRSAAQRHLERARASLDEAFGDSLQDAAAALRHQVDRLDATWIVRRRRVIRRRRRWMRIVVVAAGLLAAAGGLVLWRVLA